MKGMEDWKYTHRLMVLRAKLQRAAQDGTSAADIAAIGAWAFDGGIDWDVVLDRAKQYFGEDEKKIALLVAAWNYAQGR